MKYLAYIYVIFSLFLIIQACSDNQKRNDDPKVADTGKQVSDASKGIKDRATSIKNAADDWNKKAPSEPHHTTIVTDSAIIMEKTKQLDDAKIKLDKADATIQMLMDQRNEAWDQLDDVNKWLYRTLTMIGIVCMAGSAALVAFPLTAAIGRTFGGAIGVFGASLTAITLITRVFDRAVNEWRDWIMWGILGSVGLLFGGLIWYLWDHRKVIIDYAEHRIDELSDRTKKVVEPFGGLKP